MKTVITVVGLGKRVSGISEKTGRAYDFQSVSFVYDSPYYTGQKACMQNTNMDIWSCGLPVIGHSYDAFIHEDFKTSRVNILCVIGESYGTK